MMRYLRLAIALLRHKLLITLVVAISVCATWFVAVLLPDVYEASVLLMPEGEAVIDPRVEVVRAARGLLSADSAPDRAGQFCLDLLASRRLLDSVVDRLPELSRIWEGVHRENMRKELLSRCSFESTQSGLLRITARMTDPSLAARLANTMASELQNLRTNMALDKTRGALEFLNKRLALAGKELAAVEERYAGFQRDRKMIHPDESARATFSVLMSLESRIIEEEVRLEALKSYASAQNPQVRLQEERVKALRRKLSEIELDGNHSGDNHEPGQALIPLERLPEVGLGAARMERELRLRETLYLFLVERYESVKLAEAKESSALILIEEAEAPEMRSGPRRLLWMTLAGAIGLLAGCSFALLAERLRTLRATEEGRKILKEFKGSVWCGGE